MESRHIAANIAKYRPLPLKILAATHPIRLALAVQMDWGARASAPAAFGVPPKALTALRWFTTR